MLHKDFEILYFKIIYNHDNSINTDIDDFKIQNLKIFM